MTAQRSTWLENPAIRIELWPALGDTLLMTLFATLFAIIAGLPLGIWLFMTAKDSLAANTVVYRIVSALVDLGRSIPFIILMIALIPFARFITDSALGWQAAVVSLTISAIPFYARLVDRKSVV